jgi:outer membrane lipoprotein SlyB
MTLIVVALSLAGCASGSRLGSSQSANTSSSEGPHIYGQINSSYTKKLN